MYFSYGWPRSLLTGATAADSEAIFVAQGAGEYVVVVFNATIQVRRTQQLHSSPAQHPHLWDLCAAVVRLLHSQPASPVQGVPLLLPMLLSAAGQGRMCGCAGILCRSTGRAVVSCRCAAAASTRGAGQAASLPFKLSSCRHLCFQAAVLASHPGRFGAAASTG